MLFFLLKLQGNVDIGCDCNDKLNTEQIFLKAKDSGQIYDWREGWEEGIMIETYWVGCKENGGACDK